jgi:EAL domain-containing protein (putative c-di-GMP-specific phosphodiesterase class I)
LTSVDLAMLADLRVAAQQGELALHYQPQISLARGRTVSVEALLRWTSPTHGRVPPDRFIVLAERTGLVDRLTEWVVGEALDAQVRWRAAGLDVPVSVNLSGRSLTRPDLAAWILEQLSSRALPARALSVEITETAAPEDLAAAVELLAPLHERGVRVSIDDFGVGYTSLSVLPRLALDELKVDKGFVMRALASPTDEAIVRTVCELGRRLGLDVVAEGVEDAEVCRLVADAGYDLVQGFHFARPMPERELVDFVTVPTSPPGPGRKALAL